MSSNQPETIYPGTMQALEDQEAASQNPNQSSEVLARVGRFVQVPGPPRGQTTTDSGSSTSAQGQGQGRGQ